jgi:hypothetical protein
MTGFMQIPEALDYLRANPGLPRTNRLRRCFANHRPSPQPARPGSAGGRQRGRFLRSCGAFEPGNGCNSRYRRAVQPSVPPPWPRLNPATRCRGLLDRNAGRCLPAFGRDGETWLNKPCSRNDCQDKPALIGDRFRISSLGRNRSGSPIGCWRGHRARCPHR